jgi:single-strand DNA-binding protein
MSFDLNTVAIIGRLTRNPELKYVSVGSEQKATCTVSVANNSTAKDDNVSYFDVQLWGVVAENAIKHLKKGSQVAVIGRLDQQRWEKDGQKRSKIIIVANRVQYLSSPKESNEPVVERDSHDRIVIPSEFSEF